MKRSSRQAMIIQSVSALLLACLAFGCSAASAQQPVPGKPKQTQPVPQPKSPDAPENDEAHRLNEEARVKKERLERTRAALDRALAKLRDTTAVLPKVSRDEKGKFTLQALEQLSESLRTYREFAEPLVEEWPVFEKAAQAHLKALGDCPELFQKLSLQAEKEAKLQDDPGLAAVWESMAEFFRTNASEFGAEQQAEEKRRLSMQAAIQKIVKTIEFAKKMEDSLAALPPAPNSDVLRNAEARLNAALVKFRELTDTIKLLLEPEQPSPPSSPVPPMGGTA